MTNPTTQKNFGSLLGLGVVANELSAEDNDLLAFGRDLRQKLSGEELSLVVKICYILTERKVLIPVVLKNLQTPVPPKAKSQENPVQPG